MMSWKSPSGGVESHARSPSICMHRDGSGRRHDLKTQDTKSDSGK